MQRSGFTEQCSHHKNNYTTSSEADPAPRKHTAGIMCHAPLRVCSDWRLAVFTLWAAMVMVILVLCRRRFDLELAAVQLHQRLHDRLLGSASATQPLRLHTERAIDELYRIPFDSARLLIYQTFYRLI
jgi:hypothetical protein